MHCANTLEAKVACILRTGGLLFVSLAGGPSISLRLSTAATIGFSAYAVQAMGARLQKKASVPVLVGSTSLAFAPLKCICLARRGLSLLAVGLG